jgi:transcriptional regulator with XRE-family HTH domain
MRVRRMMLGMSQENLGEAFGVTFQQVQKYEKGVNRMGASRLQHAAQILGVSVPWPRPGQGGRHGAARPGGTSLLEQAGCHSE